jgi:SAM-dependent methyltransferase
MAENINIKPENKEYIEKLVAAMESGELEMTPLPCLCGEDNDRDISQSERFDIPVRVKLCMSCGLVRIDPYFTEEALEVFYKDHYRKIDLMYDIDEWCAHEVTDAGATLFNICKLVEGLPEKLKIIDVGCGLGAGVQWLQQQGHEVVGLDFNIEDAQKLFPDCTFTEDWEEYEGWADVVTSTQSFEHFRDPIDTARRLRNLIHDDGVVQLSVPGLDSIFETYQGRILQYLIISHPWYYTLGTLQNVMRQGGLGLIAGTEYSFSVYEKCDPGESVAPNSAEHAIQTIAAALTAERNRLHIHRVKTALNSERLKQSIKDRANEELLGKE